MNWIKNNKLISILLLACICLGIYYIYEAIKWIPYHNQMDYGEGYIQYISYMFANGTWDWNLNTPPYIPLMYGIVEPLMMIPMIKAFGNDLWTTRIIMCVSAVIIAVMIYLIVYKLTKKKIWALIGALLPFTQPIIRDWSLQARVDVLAVMFDMVGLFVFVWFKDSKHKYWSVIPFALAVFTKPTFIAGLLAIIVYLAVNNRRELIKYLAIFVPLVSVCFIVLQIISGGNYFTHIVTASRTVDLIWSWAVIQTNWVGVLTPLAIILALAVLYVRRAIVKRSIRLKELDIIGIFLLVAFVFDFMSALRPGGFLNYYLEFIYATCMCATLILPRFIEKTLEKYREEKSAIGSYALLIGLLFIFMAFMSTKTAFPFPDEQYDRDVNVVTAIIEDTDKPIITENTGLVINAGKDLYAEFFIITNWAQLRIWDDTDYINDYKNQYFDYIIMRVPLSERPDGDGHFSKEVMQAIRDNYTLVYHPPENFYWYGISLYESNNKLENDDRFIALDLPIGKAFDAKN